MGRAWGDPRSTPSVNVLQNQEENPAGSFSAQGSITMALTVIGAGIGRTGTYSLKLAIHQLWLGPCHHMEEVLKNMPTQVPLWSAAVAGHPDWERLYDGYVSAVDWPTACFFRELHTAYPDAKFILTQRSPESWADSFSSTIYKLLGERAEGPPEMKEWLEMSSGVIARTGFPEGLDRDGLIQSFEAHLEAVKQTIPAQQLLVYEVKQGWGPLCAFLDKPVPSEPFPRTNDREEFWDRVAGKI
ncbi:sulfotransferase family protein [Oleiagrimonas sp.]|uniref:sulfotransferase family protein n=1 Tax=Oleiagrimonas sp. TaxID=2010330 RepID=UPI00262703A6|nr:sulfotransferase family protein [Oleiagrimonas sp.]